jgi:hypothetical protein
MSSPTYKPSKGAERIVAERCRQIEKGYDAAHDDALPFCALRQAARAYAMRPDERFELNANGTPRPWPFSVEAWHPSPDDRSRELTIAGALYLAESEREQRAGNTDAVHVLRAKAQQCATAIEIIEAEAAAAAAALDPAPAAS